MTSAQSGDAEVSFARRVLMCASTVLSMADPGSSHACSRSCSLVKVRPGWEMNVASSLYSCAVSATGLPKQ